MLAGLLRPLLKARKPSIFEPPADEIVKIFESLGNNCEFGLVQRCAGAEPLGLFRFSNTSRIEALIQALDTDLAGYGEAGDLRITIGRLGQPVCESRSCGFAYLVSDAPASISAEALAAREARKLVYLKRRMLEDLAAGEKILVRKTGLEDRPEEIAALARAVRRHGRCKLLIVREACAGEDHGRVVRRDDTVLEGTVRRFAPEETAYDLDLVSWLAICRGAHRLVNGSEDVGPLLQPNLLARNAAKPSRHELGRGRKTGPEGLEIFRTVPVPSQRVGGAIHAFSAWIWIPSDFAGKGVDALISQHRLGYGKADLSVRDAWQQVWFGARLPADGDHQWLGLVSEGPPGTAFWSAALRLEEGPVPSPAQPPSIRIGPGSGR